MNAASPEAVALWLPAVFALVAIFATWIYLEFRPGWPYQATQKGHACRCRACGRVYVEPRRVPLSRCPVCGEVNETPSR